MFSCIATPAQIALWDELSNFTKIINYTIDAIFFIDIIVIFNSAVVDENFEKCYDRGTITCTYLKSWFPIDFVAIIPFESFVPANGEAANLVRYARLGKITKMLKLMKLLRLMKL